MNLEIIYYRCFFLNNICVWEILCVIQENSSFKQRWNNIISEKNVITKVDELIGLTMVFEWI